MTGALGALECAAANQRTGGVEVRWRAYIAQRTYHARSERGEVGKRPSAAHLAQISLMRWFIEK